LLSSTMLTLTEHPEVMDAVRQDRSLLPAVIEEVVRLHSPVVGTPRLTTAAVELGGVTIPAGELVMAMWGAGNRDPEQFPEPAEFRLHRDNIKSHLAFGWGNHFCIGSKLARAEVLMAFDVLLDEFSSLELAPGATPKFGNSLLAQSYESLPILVKRSTEGGGHR
jgi:cytochrome P450